MTIRPGEPITIGEQGAAKDHVPRCGAGPAAHTYTTVVDALDALTAALLVTTLGMTPNEGGSS